MQRDKRAWAVEGYSERSEWSDNGCGQMPELNRVTATAIAKRKARATLWRVTVNGDNVTMTVSVAGAVSVAKYTVDKPSESPFTACNNSTDELP